MHSRPAQEEYPPPFHKYIQLVPPGDLIGILSKQFPETKALLAEVTEEQAGHRYAAGKWSIRQMIGHVADSERVFAYRALRIGRNDKTPLPGFDQDVLSAGAPFDSIPLTEILREFEAVRSATLYLLRGFPAGAWERSGTSDGKPLSMRAMAYVIAGHELYHREIFRTLYLPGVLTAT